MSTTIMYVIFERDTGKVLGISPKSEHENSIPVSLSEVTGILEGTELRKNYSVEYNPKTKQLQLFHLDDENFDSPNINDLIYQIPENVVVDADVIIEQDIPQKCWRFRLGEELKKNFNSKEIRYNTTLFFSITAKDDPNILFKSLSVNFLEILNSDYITQKFSMPFETKNTPLSIFTARNFDTYQFKRIL